MTLLFSKSSPEIIEAILVPNSKICIFSQNFAISQIRGCKFQWFFEIPSQKYTNKTFLASNLKTFRVLKICLITKYCDRVKKLKFGTKGATCGYFWTRVLSHYCHI